MLEKIWFIAYENNNSELAQWVKCSKNCEFKNSTHTSNTVEIVWNLSHI